MEDAPSPDTLTIKKTLYEQEQALMQAYRTVARFTETLVKAGFISSWHFEDPKNFPNKMGLDIEMRIVTRGNNGTNIEEPVRMNAYNIFLAWDTERPMPPMRILNLLYRCLLTEALRYNTIFLDRPRFAVFAKAPNRRSKLDRIRLKYDQILLANFSHFEDTVKALVGELEEALADFIEVHPTK